jgi:1-acyl-sn-glycerol-3-phosphate acyltransferase
MKRTPVLGQIVTLAGCLFVERRSKANIKNEIKDIQEAMVQGISIAVFPEATSSNADGVLPLKRSLFEAAKLADVAVKPVVINYTHVSGTNLNKINRDSICWYGDMKFVPHLLTLCFEKNINATVTFGDPILATDSIDLRDQSFNFISEHFNGLEK